MEKNMDNKSLTRKTNKRGLRSAVKINEWVDADSKTNNAIQLSLHAKQMKLQQV